VVAYYAQERRVELSDGWGDTRTFSISEVWIAPAPKAEVSGSRRRVSATLISAGAGLGALIGSIITALLMRG
jgi:hypothetical protein